MNSKNKIYLDYAATTPIDPRVMKVISPYFSQVFGNPSSVHTFGQQTEAALEKSRETVSHYLSCRPDEIIFTSCGSESDNLALRGAAIAAQRDRDAKHILISPVEHHAVTNTAIQLSELYGFELEYLPVNEFGQVNPADVAGRLRENTAVISVIFANNEIGSINPIGEIGAICRERGIPFHTDAVQAAAYLPVDVDELMVDLLAIGAHKFYGPKGVGALYVRKGTPIVPSQTGGGQEFGLRAGTSNIPYIVGLAEALRLANDEQAQRQAHLMALRDRVIGYVLKEIPDTKLTGHPVQRLPNHASFVFRGVDGNALLTILDVEGFACSSGSACKTGDPEPSEVLTSLGIDQEWALGSLRVTLGTHTTAEDVETFLAVLPKVVQQARSLAK
ncbi:MAG: cysteine desulfurase [Anaerolineales bacterium]|nr:cysteine desulfurase [Anaerolineales bacterium]